MIINHFNRSINIYAVMHIKKFIQHQIIINHEKKEVLELDLV